MVLLNPSARVQSLPQEPFSSKESALAFIHSELRDCNLDSTNSATVHMRLGIALLIAIIMNVQLLKFCNHE